MANGEELILRRCFRGALELAQTGPKGLLRDCSGGNAKEEDDLQDIKPRPAMGTSIGPVGLTDRAGARRVFDIARSSVTHPQRRQLASRRSGAFIWLCRHKRTTLMRTRHRRS